jgi:LAS superfamily LD-carboxypeptidase LdcB
MSIAVLKRAPAPPRSLRSRLALLLTGLVACVVAVSGCQVGHNINDPINPANRPTTLAGYSNGFLPSSLLHTYSSQCKIYKPAAGSLADMLAAAHRDGVNLQPVECYRSYAGQVYQRNYWCGVGICANAAVPGTSNHGWGKAVDLRDQNGSLSWGSVGYKWMVANASAWGWNHPGGVNEAWHWEWVGDGGTMHGYQIRVDLMSWAN